MCERGLRNRQTSGSVLAACNCRRLVDALREEILTHAVLRADETPVAMLKPGNGKTHKAYLWSLGVVWVRRAEDLDHARQRRLGASSHVKRFGGQPDRVDTDHRSNSRIQAAHSTAAVAGHVTLIDVAPRRSSIRMSGAHPASGIETGMNDSDGISDLRSDPRRARPPQDLRDVLERLPTQPASRIDELLPHRWQPQGHFV